MADYVIAKAVVKTVSIDGSVPLISRYQCGEAIVAGKGVSISLATGLAMNCDISTQEVQDLKGMALNDGAIGQPIDIIEAGFVDVGVGVGTAGDICVASFANSGGLSSWSDLVTSDIVSVLGVFYSSDLIKVSIHNTDVPKG